MLREFLRERFTPERLRYAASADYDFDGDAIAEEFRHNLETGHYTYARTEGNPYACAVMQQHEMTSERPLYELFGGWWLGTFCSDPGYFVLIDNLGVPNGVDALLHMVVRGCGELGQDARKAAHAAIPFVYFLQSRTPPESGGSFSEAVAALEAIERLGTDGMKSGRYQGFMTKFSE